MQRSPSHLLDGQPTGDDLSQEDGLRPALLADFQGQTRIKENLAVFITAARQRDEAMDHLFISGPPGLGKTTLASIVAAELGVPMSHTAAPALDKPKDLAGLLAPLEPRSLVFIDELHRLKPTVEELLYSAMEDFYLDWLVGQGQKARAVRIPLPPFTLVGATTRPGKVSRPMLTRFGINLRINYYSHQELVAVLRRSAKILRLDLEPAAAALLADSARGTPRVANRLLRRMRDFAQIENSTAIKEELVRRSLARLEVDQLGLERLDREILLAVIDKFAGGPVGAETLAIAVGESVDSLEDFYEPYLIQRGLLERTPRGRVATLNAYRHLHRQPKSDGHQQFLF